MSIGLRLDLRQSQQLVMTPQLQQAIKLLQMSNLEIGTFVEQELEKNPLLERERVAEEPPLPDPSPAVEATDRRVTIEGDHTLAAETFDTGAENLHDTSPGDGPPPLMPSDGWASVGKGGTEDWTDFTDRLDERPSLRVHLLNQIGPMGAPPQIDALARLLVEELDEHGYLRAELAELAQRLGADCVVLQEALALVQRCEPTGVGARDLAECLALQLAEINRLDPAMQALLNNLDLLERGEVKRLRQKTGVDQEDLAQMLVELRALDPRPCAIFDTREAETLVPDVLVRRNAYAGWHVELNTDTLPRLIMNSAYAAEVGGTSDEAKTFVAECRATASWLIKSLDQRARTILRVASEIVRQQEEFLRIGVAGLRPLTLKDVAEAVDLHESTVSRVTSNKYMATERGILELKFFFSNAVGGGSGENHAAEAVRHRIKTLVDAETAKAILSDDAIVVRLQSEGIEIARRTVAKYRKSLNIPSSSERRRRKAMAPCGNAPAAP